MDVADIAIQLGVLGAIIAIVAGDWASRRRAARATGEADGAGRATGEPDGAGRATGTAD
jgi:hypothetical protein